MTKLERIMLIALLVLVAGIAIFWKDVQRVLGGDKNTVVEREFRNKKDKDKKDKDKNKKDKKDKEDDKDEVMNTAFHLAPSFC